MCQEATLLSWGILCLWMNKHVSVPSISTIPWNSWTISLAMALYHFGFYGTFIRWLYYWYFPVSGQMKALISPGWIVNFPVVLLMWAQSSPVLCTVMLVGTRVGIFLGRIIVVMWLAMILSPFRRLTLVLYLCTSGTLNMLPQYGWVSGGMNSVSSGMTCRSIWGGFLFFHPGVIAILVLV